MKTKSPKSLDPVYYYDRDIFRMEQEQIFCKNWWLMGVTHELTIAGDYIAGRIGRFPVLVLLDHHGELKGFHNTCRHRAGPLVTDSLGSCPGKLLVCKYHGWSYDFDGELKNAHSLNQAIDRTDYSLYPIRVSTWNGMVFACLDQQCVELETWLGDIIDIAVRFPNTLNFSPQGLIEKQGKTNWKSYGDNSCEGYHVGLVHQSLGTVASSDNIELGCFDNGKFIGFDVNYSPSTEDPSRQGEGYWIYKFPGLLLHFAEYSFNAESVMPISENEIMLRRWFWVDTDQAKKRGVTPDEIVASASLVMDEDLDICERVYENLAAGVYQPGVLSEADEPGTIYFQNLVMQQYQTSGISLG